MKIVNVGNVPYFWTYDGFNQGPLQPGEVVELDEPMALHAIKRSQILEPETGELLGYSVRDAADVDPGTFKIRCPFSVTENCKAQPFSTTVDLLAHIEKEHSQKPKRKGIQDHLSL